jgi:predicted double-glycine peptidase
MDKPFHLLSQDAQVQTLLGANTFINNNFRVIINFHSNTVYILDEKMYNYIMNMRT